MASCEGLKGKEYKKCMSAYVKKSKRHFPTFNQEKDTVAYGNGYFNGKPYAEKSRKFDKKSY